MESQPGEGTELNSADQEARMNELLERYMNNLTLGVASQKDIDKWTKNKKLVLKSITENEHWSFHGPPYPTQQFEDVEISMENNIGLSHLVDEIGKAVPNKVFICRTIIPSIGGGGGYEPVESAVEDLQGRVVRMSLFNYSNSTNDMKPLGVVLPEGTIIAVKNPPLHVLQNEIGQSRVAVCAVNPADVELLSYKNFRLLSPGHSWIKTIENPLWKGTNDTEIGLRLKRLGNEFFVEGRWTDALRWYKLSLEYFDDYEENEETENLCLQVVSNVAAAFLQMGLYVPAAANVDLVLAKKPNDIKANYRMAKALIGMKLYEKALEYLDGEFKRNPELANNEDLSILRERAETLCKAKSSGDLGDQELSKMVSAYLRKPEDIDTTEIAEIDTPILKVKRIEENMKYRGLIATENLPPGKLLMCAKAFGYLQAGGKSYPSYDIAERERSAQVVAEIANKIAFYPAFGKDFYNLWEGPFLYPPFAKESPILETQDEEEMKKKVDLKRIQGIVKMNAFVCSSEHPDKNGLGLWILPSYFNHSCGEANAHWKSYGDVMIIRTFREVKKGEEVLIPYLDPSNPLEVRKDYFLARAFVCKCNLCKLEATEDSKTVKQRQDILKWFEDFDNASIYPVHILTIAEGIGKFKKLLEFRRQTPELNPCLRFQSVKTWILCFIETGNKIDGKLFLELVLKAIENFAYLQNVAIDTQCIKLKCQIELREKKDEVRKSVMAIRNSLKLLYGTIESVKSCELRETLEFVKVYLGKDFFED